MLKLGEQCLHLVDFFALALNNAVRQFTHAWVRKMSTLAGQNRDRMMRDHGFHSGDVINRGLDANQPEGQGQRQRDCQEI